MTIYQITEERGRVLIENLSRPAGYSLRYRRFDFGELSAVADGERIHIKKGLEFVIRDKKKQAFQDLNGEAFSNTVSGTVDGINKVLLGQRSRTYTMTGYGTDTSFSGDVDYITFPVSPYSDIIDQLDKESVCFGDASDSTRGTSNTLELRNLSSGSEVKYEVKISYNVDAVATFTIDSPTGQFQSSTHTSASTGTNSFYIMSGTSTVTNAGDWKMYASIDTDGSGTYRVSEVKITITR